MKQLKVLFTMALCFAFTACSGDSNGSDENKAILVEKVIINGTDIDNGQPQQLQVVVLPNNATNRAVTWSVSDESVALISEKGLLTPLENGSVKVTVTAIDASSASVEKTINISGVPGPVTLVESVTVTGSDITDGTSKQFTAQVLPANATKKVVTWSVSDTSIAEINSEGLLTPLKNGTVQVTATATDGSGITGELSVTISGMVLTNLKAENVLLWQRSNGGWPKEPHNAFSGYDRPQTEAEIAEANNKKGDTDTTIDNNHTINEIRILLSAYKATNNTAYLEAAIRGIDFIFEMQYDNGGWPQYYPLRDNYSRYITYNDNAMSNVMNLLRDIFLKRNNLELIDESYVNQAQTAFDKGIDVILQTQILVSGIKTAWCAQHDDVTLAPAKARSYELESISGSESVGVTRLLMSLESPSADVIDAVHKAMAWFESVKIVGYNLVDVTGSEYENGYDKILVESPGNVMWGRFYDLETNEPFFCSRDGIKKATIAEISHERRNGYAWYGNWPKNLISSEYTAWKNKHGL